MVPKQPTPFTVALINNNEDLLAILQAFLTAEGIPAAIEHLARFKRGEANIAQFLTEQDPQVVVWDIPPPTMPIGNISNMSNNFLKPRGASLS